MIWARIKGFRRRHKSKVFAAEFSFVLLLFAIAAGISEAKAEGGKVWISLRSAHYEHNSRYNNNNLGIYVEHQRVIFGVFENSFNNTAGLVGYDMGSIAQAGPVNMGWTIGAALGYEQQPVIVAPALTFAVGRAMVVATPYVSTLVVKIGEW